MTLEKLVECFFDIFDTSTIAGGSVENVKKHNTNLIQAEKFTRVELFKLKSNYVMSFSQAGGTYVISVTALSKLFSNKDDLQCCQLLLQNSKWFLYSKLDTNFQMRREPSVVVFILGVSIV